MSLVDGQSVGRYRIVGFLGAGAMGEVYLAEDPHIERKLAIKTVRLAGRPQEIEDRKKRLLREARAAGRLLHPNVVTLFDAGEVEGLLYLAFELVEGEDLGSRLATGFRPSLRQVLRIVRQTAEALDYAHGQGIVHRDIKPSNILLDPAGRVKVADFGIAKMAGQSTELTVAGAVMGSPQYLSPEQIRGDGLDGRTDVFSLGVVLYELLSGKRPFDGDTITTLVYQILHKEPPPIAELRAVPPRLEQLLGRMLAKDRDERIAPAGRIAEELAAIESELSDETLSAAAAPSPFEPTHALPRRTTTPQRMPPPPPPGQPTAVPAPPQGVAAAARPAKSRLWVPIAAALVLVAALAAGWQLLSRDEPDAAAPTVARQTAPAAAPAQTGLPPGGAQAPDGTSPPAASAASQAPAAPEERPSSSSTSSTPPPAASPPPFAEQPLRRGPVPPRGRSEGNRAGEPAAPGPRTAPDLPRDEPASVSGSRDEIASAPEPAAAPSAARSTAPSMPLPGADRTIQTGLGLAFRVLPPDAFVLVDRTPIGRAGEWSGQRGNRFYTLPGPGSYQIRIRKDGMKEYRILVEANASGVVTPVLVRLEPLPAAEVPTADLEVVRVREAISFRVTPPNARIAIDGQPLGLARRFAGRLGRPEEWVPLTPGRHRVSVAAQGYRTQDIAVEVTAGAEKERMKIPIDLVPARPGEE